MRWNKEKDYISFILFLYFNFIRKSKRVFRMQEQANHKRHMSPPTEAGYRASHLLNPNDLLVDDNKLAYSPSEKNGKKLSS